MGHQTDDLAQKLERALAATYRSRSDVPQDIDVTQHVMHDIRRAGTERGWWAPSAVLDQLVWRTATITAAVVLVATMLTVGVFRPQTGESPALLAEEFEPVPLFED
jgi:hypothetical protein